MRKLKVVITGHKVDGGLGMSYLRAFQELGCSVSFFDDQGLFEDKYKKFMNRYTYRFFWKLLCPPIQKAFISFIDNEKPDLIVVLKGWFFKPETLKAVKEKYPGTKIFCFNQENPFNTWNLSYSNKWIIESIPLYDVYFTWGNFMMDRIRDEGNAKRVEYLPFACDPSLHYPVIACSDEKKEYEADVAFIGSYDKEREFWVKQLLDFNIAIWGNAWGKADKAIADKWKRRAVIGDEFSKVCNSSKIIVDILRKQMIHSHSMKTFEIPACKGFLLCTRGGELPNFFDEGKEIACFSTADELRKKIRYYLENEEERWKMAEVSYKKALIHTYLQRAKRIIEVFEEIKRERAESYLRERKIL